MQTVDNLDPLAAFGGSGGDVSAELLLEAGVHHDDVLLDFPDIWGADASPPPVPKKQAMSTSRSSSSSLLVHQIHGRNYSYGGGESTTQDVSETETTPSQHGGGRHNHHYRRSIATNNTGGTTTNSSVISNVSSEATDDASRASGKRRRVGAVNIAASSSSSYPGFQPNLAQVREDKDDGDVRPWMVEVRDHDVVLGDTHEPTRGTKIYREVRRPYAKKTLDNEQLKMVKTEFQRKLEKDLGQKLECPPTFWANKEYTSKIKQSQVAGFLKNRPGITYAYAKDTAIKEDIKNASARSRTRSTKIFNCKGSLVDVIQKAMSTVEEWVGDDIDKELYAKNFREDLKRFMPWHGVYVDKKRDCEQRARGEPELKGTHMREAKIHETHASHLEIAMVEMINQMGNLMVESHRTCNKKSTAAAVRSSTASVDGSASYNSSHIDPLSNSHRSKPPLGMRSVPEQRTTASARARGGISARARPLHRREEPGNNTVASSTLSGGAYSTDDRVTMEEDGNGSVDMDVSPISVRKAMLTENLGQTFVMSGATSDKRTSKKELEVMFNTLRMGSGDDVPREVDQEAPDELSVLSMPDDVSVLLEARELAIRRGIDQPAALPRAGHVADRTKALLQQMGSQGKKEEKG